MIAVTKGTDARVAESLEKVLERRQIESIALAKPFTELGYFIDGLQQQGLVHMFPSIPHFLKQYVEIVDATVFHDAFPKSHALLAVFEDRIKFRPDTGEFWNRTKIPEVLC